MGRMIGNPGYPRGNVPRNSYAFLTQHDATMTHLLPPNGRPGGEIWDTDLMCMPSQERFNETAGSPILNTTAGSTILLRYQENGHITLPNTPPDTLKAIHNIWTQDGKGGDQKGSLLAKLPFDDGTCYQVNDSPESYRRQRLPQPQHDAYEGTNLWCGNTVEIPKGVRPGIHSLYWVWDWPSYEHGVQKPEIYTTCIDIEVTE
ncbi:MAG: hypothetical protein Q9157_007028 [Trypethelium eluteriae]